MGRRAKKDLNHDELVAIFLELQCYVLDTHREGRGLPDLFVFFRNVWYPVEIKSSTGYGKRGLNPRQAELNASTGNTFCVVRNRDEVIALVQKWAGGAVAIREV